MKTFLIALLFLVVLGGGWFWFQHRGVATAEPAATQPVARVEVAPL